MKRRWSLPDWRPTKNSFVTCRRGPLTPGLSPARGEGSNRWTAAWIFSAMVVTCCSHMLAATPRDLIVNGGFEDGLAGWNADPHQELVTGKSVARSGAACLTGEVTQPKQALILRKKVPVKAGNQYEFRMAARATNGAKIVLWAVFPGETQKKNIAMWDKLRPRWQPLSVVFNSPADGDLELQITGPSSHNAPVGRVWMDDIALVERQIPPATVVSGDVGFNDEPSLARAADGSYYVAWISFRDGLDTLQLARYEIGEKSAKPLAAWQIVGGKGTYVFHPKVVATGDGAAVVYAAEQNRVWNLYAVPCGPDGPGKPLRITNDAASDINPSAAWRADVLWITWESNRNGVQQVLLTSIRGGQIGTVEAVSGTDVNAYNPSLAVLESGALAVAWHSFADDNFDVYLRRRAAGGAWQPEVRVTRAPTIDRHPVLCARGDELWLAYENAQVLRYHMGATNFRRLIVGKLDGDKLLVPKNYQQSPLYGRCESPALAFDAAGRLWLAHLRPRPRAGWDAWLTCYDGAGWQEPAPLGLGKGMDRRPSLAIDGQRVIAATQVDDIPNGWSDAANSRESKSNAALCVAPLDTAEKTVAMQLEPLVEPDEEFEAAQIHRERGEHVGTPTIESQGQTYKLFFGDLHHHSDISVCNRCGDQSVEEGYQNMRDINRLDFACSTDHCYNINPYLWTYLGKMARVHEQSGRFLTFLAEEWTSTFEEYDTKHPYGFYGHRNLIFGDTYFPRWWTARNRQTPAEVWEELRAMNADFVHIPHQLADTGNVPTDWNYADEKAQPVAEIFQTRGSYEHSGTVREAPRATPPGYFIQDAWARGVVVGVIASPDHGGGYGKACVYAPELSRKAILEALRQRRCYGTTAAKIFLDVRVNDRLMGESAAEAPTGPVTVKIRTACPGDIDRVEVCRNNRYVYVNRPAGKSCALTFVDREPLAGRSYYYVRVIQKDEEIAWSSPVWFGKQQ